MSASPIAYLREIDAGTDSAAGVICAKGDPGAVPVVPMDSMRKAVWTEEGEEMPAGGPGTIGAMRPPREWTADEADSKAANALAEGNAAQEAGHKSRAARRFVCAQRWLDLANELRGFGEAKP